MIGIKRIFINMNWDKMQVKDNGINASHVKCMKLKWNPFRDDWKQGFDSDCFGHCSEFNKCSNAFFNKEYHRDNHFKVIIMPFEKIPHGETDILQIEI